MKAANTELSTEDFNWDEIYVLNPKLGIRPDIGRALIFNRNPIEFRRGCITTERAIMTALLDGKKNLNELATVVGYLFDLNPTDSKNSVTQFLKAGLTEVGKEMLTDALIKIKDLPSNKKIRKYDPNKFAEAGSNWPGKRKLKSPITITWMLSPNCATDCIYCYADKRPIGPNDCLSDSRIRDLIQEVIELEIPIISLTGGDPFMNTHLLDYLEIILEAGIGVELPTKVPLNREQVHRLAQMGFDEIQIGIDGPNANICDFMVRTPGWFDRMIKTIRLLTEAGIKVRTNTILTSYNIDYAEETVHMLCSLGVQRVKLTNYNRSTYHHSESFWVPSLQANKLLKKMDGLKRCYPNTTLLYDIEKDYSEMTIEEKNLNWPPPPSCTAFVNTLVICPDGNCIATEEIMQCQQYILGNVKHQSIQEVWDSSRLEQVYHASRDLFKGTVCFKCEDFDKCHYEWGYCFRDAYKAYGSIYAPAPSCPKAPQGRKLMGTIE